MLEDFRLKVFVTVAQTGGFTKAADILGVSQPAVSQNISELEKGLGIKLFLRQRGEAVLTAEGKVFMRYAERLLSVSRETDSLFSPVSSAVVRVSASEGVYSYFLASCLTEFSSIHPEVTFERALLGEADLSIEVRPSCGSPYDHDPEVLADVRVSMCLPEDKKDGISAVHERSSGFELLFRPSASFACTRLCRIIRDFLASSIS